MFINDECMVMYYYWNVSVITTNTSNTFKVYLLN